MAVTPSPNTCLPLAVRTTGIPVIRRRPARDSQFVPCRVLKHTAGLVALALGLGLSTGPALGDGADSPDICKVGATVNGSNPTTTVTAPSGFVVASVCIKSGDDSFGSLKHSALIVSDGAYGSNNCYTVAGIGTGMVTVTRGASPPCKDISHVDYVTVAGGTPNVGIAKANNTGGTVGTSASFDWILTVTVSNGPTTAGATITDTIPIGLTAGAPVPSSGQLDCGASVGNAIICTLASGTTSGDYTITVPIATPDGSPTSECKAYDNTASVTGGGGTNTPSSDTDSVTVTCPAPATPNVGIAKANNTGGTVGTSSSFDWTLTVTVSNGPTTAVATITDSIPANLTAGAPVPGSGQLDCGASVGNAISCTLASGSASGDYTITVPITTPDGTPPSECTTYTNTGFVSGGGGTNTPPSDSDSVTVACGATGSITVDKVTSPAGHAQPFAFEVQTGASAGVDSFSLTDLAAPHTTAGLAAGTYKILETPVAGWATSAVCAGGPFGAGMAYTPGSTFVLEAGDQVSCTFTNLLLRPAGFDFCRKTAVTSLLNPNGKRFAGNAGLDHLVRVDLGESIQAALDAVNDANNDGYVLIGVIANATGGLGGHTDQHFEINRAYPRPFALVGCSVTVHDDDLANARPTARIAATASNPATSPASGAFQHPSIFVMDLHAEDSEVAGWTVEGNGRELLSVNARNNLVGVVLGGAGTAWRQGTVEKNRTLGVSVGGSGHVVDTVKALDNGGAGFAVSGTGHTLHKCAAGDKNKGNGGPGIALTGTGHVVRECVAYANGGSGITAAGSAHQLLKNTLGDPGKGNAGDGIAAAGAGLLLQENRARANAGDGLDVSGGTLAAPNRLRQNQSNTGGAGGNAENGGAEYRLLNVVNNAGGGNKADNVVVPKVSAPAKCPAFPATNATVAFVAPFVCE